MTTDPADDGNESGSPLTPDERAELARLRRTELARLRTEAAGGPAGPGGPVSAFTTVACRRRLASLQKVWNHWLETTFLVCVCTRSATALLMGPLSPLMALLISGRSPGVICCSRSLTSRRLDTSAATRAAMASRTGSESASGATVAT